MLYIDSIETYNGDVISVEVKDTSDSSFKRIVSCGDFNAYFNTNHVEGVFNLTANNWVFHEVSQNPSDIKFNFMNRGISIKREGSKLVSLLTTPSSFNDKMIIDLASLCDELDENSISLLPYSNLTLIFNDDIKIPKNPYIKTYISDFPILDLRNCSRNRALEIGNTFLSVYNIPTTGILDRLVLTDDTFVRNILFLDNAIYNCKMSDILESDIDRQFIINYCRNHYFKLRQVLLRRNYTYHEINDLGLYIIDSNKHVGHSLMTLRDLNDILMLNRDLFSRLKSSHIILDHKKYITDNDVFYLKLALFMNEFGIAEECDITEELESFLRWVRTQYWGIKNELSYKFHKFISKFTKLFKSNY